MQMKDNTISDIFAFIPFVQVNHNMKKRKTDSLHVFNEKQVKLSFNFFLATLCVS